MSIDLTELKRLAKAAIENCPHEWKLQKYEDDGVIVDMGFTTCTHYTVDTAADSSCLTEPLAKFIAAANPAAVLELVKEVERLREHFAANQVGKVQHREE